MEISFKNGVTAQIIIDTCLFIILAYMSLSEDRYSYELKKKRISIIHNRQPYDFNITSEVAFSHIAVSCMFYKHLYQKSYSNIISYELDIIHHSRYGDDRKLHLKQSKDLSTTQNITLYEFNNLNVKNTEFNLTIFEGGMGFEAFDIEMKSDKPRTFMKKVNISLSLLIILEMIYFKLLSKKPKQSGLYFVLNLSMLIYLIFYYICEWSLLMTFPLLVLVLYTSIVQKFGTTKHIKVISSIIMVLSRMSFILSLIHI